MTETAPETTPETAPESILLKYARARDDQDFRWRIAAAMSIKAQGQASWDLSAPDRRLTDWVLENPMIAVERMVSAVSVNPTIAGNVSVTNGAVNTSKVPDGDIIYVVDQEWVRVAGQLFEEAARTGTATDLGAPARSPRTGA